MSRFIISLSNVVGDLIMEGVGNDDEDIYKRQKAIYIRSGILT